MFIPYIGGFNGVLDNLDIAENAVFIFSPYKRLIKSYIGKAIRVQRTTDYTSMDIGFNSDGTINQTELLNFCGAGDGLVEIVYNQANSNYNAVQATLDNKPKVVVSGVFESDGILFDGVNDYYKVEDYTEIQLIDDPISIYYDIVPLYTGLSWLMAKTETYNNNDQFAVLIYNDTFIQKIYNTSLTPVDLTIGENLKYLSAWQNKLSNGLKSIWNDGNANTTKSSSLVNKTGFFIGVTTGDGLTPLSTHFDGNIRTIIIFNSYEYDKYSDIANI